MSTNYPGLQVGPGSAASAGPSQMYSAGSPIASTSGDVSLSMQQHQQQQAFQQQQQQQQQQQASTSSVPFNHHHQQQQQQQPGPWMLPPGLDRDKLTAMTSRMAQLRAAGQTEQTSPELAHITTTLNNIQRHMNRLRQMQMAAQQQQQQPYAQQAGSPPASLPNGFVPGNVRLQQQQSMSAAPPANAGLPNGMSSLQNVPAMPMQAGSPPSLQAAYQQQAPVQQQYPQGQPPHQNSFAPNGQPLQPAYPSQAPQSGQREYPTQVNGAAGSPTGRPSTAGMATPQSFEPQAAASLAHNQMLPRQGGPLASQPVGDQASPGTPASASAGPHAFNSQPAAGPTPTADNASRNDQGLKNGAERANMPEQHVNLTPQQMAAFKAQIFALRFLQKGQPIPPQIAAVIFNNGLPPPSSAPASAKDPQSVTGPPVSLAPTAAVKQEQLDSANGTPKSAKAAIPPQPASSDVVQGGMAPSLVSANIVPTPDISQKERTLSVPPQTAIDPQQQRPQQMMQTSYATQEQMPINLEPEIVIEDLEPTLIAPYNAYKHPRQVLASLRTNIAQAENLHYKASPVVPSLLPAGLDSYTLQKERNKYIEARIAQRKKELEDLPSLLGDGKTSGVLSADELEALPDSKKRELLASQKLKALIELKSLNLLQKQRQLREDVVRGLHHAISLNLVADRNAYRAPRKSTLKDARMIDAMERQQKIDRENRAKQKHIDQLLAIAKHGKAMDEAHGQRRSRMQRLGKNILRWHVEAEKEEQKRIERISKERLKALKNNDEEAYMRLIDTAKDTRITHLLRQTDSFLDSLAQAVAAQQAEATDKDPKNAANDAIGTNTDGAVDESAFGAAPVFDDEVQDKGKVDYYNVAHRIKENVVDQPKILSGGTLKEYQIKGLQWMISLYNNRLNGILADEMGLGKTIQTISLITFLIERKHQNGPFLCIVPLSTLPNWTLEFAKWAPSVKVIIYKGSPPVRKSVQNRMRYEGFQVCLTTYEYIIKDRPFLSRYKWIHMIIDEGHRMKNTNSKLSQTLTQYYSSRYRLILTGTPLQNNLPELWALLNFVLPKVFNSQKSFDEWFNTPFANTGGQDKIDLNEEEALLIIRRLHKVLRPFLLRRLKKDVESELPDKVERLIRCKMSALQLKLYKQMKETGMLITHDGKGSSKTGMRGLQNTIMQLRKICNHPFVFDEVENLINPTSQTNALLYRVAGKFELLDRILPKLFAGGHRVLMFFQMTEIMNIMEDYLRYRNTRFLRLDGSTKPDERSDMLKDFNDPNSEIPIFLLSTRAGGLGLNLQTADTVIIYDSDWNPHQDLQAQDRAHRIGQKKEVRIFRLVTEKSVEEQILARAREKLEIDKKVIQGGRFDNKSSAAEREDFLRAILESNEDEEEESADLGDDELNEILARGDDETEMFTRMDIERTRNEELAWIRAGGTGPPPARLITDAELPQVYHIEHVIQPVLSEVLDQRRKKAQIHYDDGLTEEQFLNALEDENTDLQDVIERNRRRNLGGLMDDNGYSGSEGGGGGGTGTRGSTSFQDWDSDGDSVTPNGRKRKRTGFTGSRATSVDATSINGDFASRAQQQPPKRRKMTKQAMAEDPERVRMKEIMEACFDAVEDVDNEEHGHQCAGLFYKLPSKKDYPHYFIIIRQPICLDQIRKKINTWKYDSLEEYVADMRLMFNNARTFNDEGSVVYNDANSMEAVFDQKMAEMTGSGDSKMGVVGKTEDGDEEEEEDAKKSVIGAGGESSRRGPPNRVPDSDGE